MNSQKNQLDFFDHLSSEIAFSSTLPTTDELKASINTSRATQLLYTDLASGETLKGSFYLEKNLLVYHQGENEVPEIILDMSYARLQIIFRCTQKSVPKIYLYKNQNTHEIIFNEQNDYDEWMLKLSKVCVLTNFEKKYQVAEETEKREDFSECLLETKMGGNHFSAKKFDRKQITSSKSSFTRIHLMNEIQVLRTLRTKNVISLKEVYETEDSIYLVTEFIHDVTLKKMLKVTSAPFSVSKTRTIMQQILKALAEMASKKTVHRNLKPSSILMENKQNIKITNFGLASFVNISKANVGICGTPGYIAPEILKSSQENRVYDDKVDVFSAGCILFEMLFGYPLFKGSKTSEISSSNKHFKYSDLIQLVTKEQNNLQPHSTKLALDLLLKLLHNDPKQRISAEEALDDIYFGVQETTPSKRFSVDESNLTPKSPQGRLSLYMQDARKRVSFDLSSNNSTSLRGSLTEAAGSQEGSMISLSPPTSFRKLSEDTSTRSISPSRFKNQSRFKTAQEIALPTLQKGSSENLILQKISVNLKEIQNDEDSDNAIGETSPISPNYPIVSPRIQKHPNQRV